MGVETLQVNSEGESLDIGPDFVNPVIRVAVRFSHDQFWRASASPYSWRKGFVIAFDLVPTQ